MKKNAIFFLICSLSFTVTAQEPTPAKTSKETPELKKNELSINTTPGFAILFGTTQSDMTRFSITYKRTFKQNNALRYSILADLINAQGFNERARNEVILLQDDSTMIKQIDVTPLYISPQLRIGYERLFGGKRLRWFYGGDMAFGYSRNHSYKQNIILTRNGSSGGWVETDLAADIVSRTQTKTITVGFSPFFGAKYSFSKHFAVSAQSGVDFSFKHNANTVTDHFSTQTHSFSSFDFNAGNGIVSDVSLIYKF